MATDLVIDVQKLNKFFAERHAVKDLDLQVRQGEIFGFLGANGSGKTTSIRLLCGLLTPDSGSGTCLGYDVIRESRRIKSQVGYMTQKFSLWDDLTVAENLNFVGRMFAVRQRHLVVDQALAGLGLQERAGQLTGTLSGGWKQRLALAACLLHQPRLLLLDEPTAGVDPKARREFWQEIHALTDQGVTVLVSTHYMDEAERCHRLAYINQGALLASGTAQELIGKQNLRTWSLNGDHLHDLVTPLEQLDGVKLVSRFGLAVRVCTSTEKMPSALQQFIEQHQLQVQAVDVLLEEAFMDLMKQNKDGRS